MGYTLIEHGLRTHPKALRAGPEAMWLHYCGLLWSDEHGTGGVIELEALDGVGPGVQHRRLLKLAARLVDAGLWETRCSAWTIHDFTQYQRSPEEVSRDKARAAAERARARERKRLQRVRSNGT